MKFVHKEKIQRNSLLRQVITESIRMDEKKCVEQLLANAKLTEQQRNGVQAKARELITNIRLDKKKQIGIDNFLQEFSLNSEEGIALMCLAEALLRTPDKKTIDQLIRDKLSGHNWQVVTNKKQSIFMNAATWALTLTGKIIANNTSEKKFSHYLSGFFQKTSAPVIRKALERAMQVMSKQFIIGRTIEEALQHAKENEKIGYCYSYDMLGEAARTAEDANHYFSAYQAALQKMGTDTNQKTAKHRPSISVKLSALHPRYEFAKRERVLDELTPKLLSLAKQAKAYHIDLNIDAEEVSRLDLMLDLFEMVYQDESLNGWQGLGLALQSYLKAAYYIIDWLATLSKKHQRKINIRLVKGAYWDTEIKDSQALGLTSFPVFTRKASTDISFQACAKKLLSLPEYFQPQFATHNANSVALILQLAEGRNDFEFQCLHGMGQALYDQIVLDNTLNIPCRMYGPVGGYEDLLAYLVRRLLENGANTSFVNRITDENTSIEALIVDPVDYIERQEFIPNPHIPLPADIFHTRLNSSGMDLNNQATCMQLAIDLAKDANKNWTAAAIVAGVEHYTNGEAVTSPIDPKKIVGHVQYAELSQVTKAIEKADNAFDTWSKTNVQQRSECLRRTADLFEKHQIELMSLAILEAGKTINDAESEVREAVDFLRYYAEFAEKLQTEPETLQGYTGESNQLHLVARGTLLCISPWNFPLAIFTGQVAACLAVGNTVIAKPANQTSLIAAVAVRLLHAAGIPDEVLHLLPGSGKLIAGALINDTRIKGVLFTGSTATAQVINQQLAARNGAIVPLIAETGGQNVMIVDSTALLEQTVVDIISSAFGSAGQRCSALRVLFIQEDIYDNLIHMLIGAMAEISVSDPRFLSTDVGPVIDKSAYKQLSMHAERMSSEAELIYQCEIDSAVKEGNFFAPRAFKLKSLKQLTQEVFGPILHVISYKHNELDQVINDINETGFGLTLGIQSRINERIEYIRTRINVGNIYINRNMTGAIVGVQPFGGEGLSGTGPKAGGPHYLPRLCHERAVTVNTVAMGGNASLLMLKD